MKKIIIAILFVSVLGITSIASADNQSFGDTPRHEFTIPE